MQVQVSLKIEIEATANLTQMEQQIQEAGRQAMREAGASRPSGNGKSKTWHALIVAARSAGWKERRAECWRPPSGGCRSNDGACAVCSVGNACVQLTICWQICREPR
jgi:hypothetical protein